MTERQQHPSESHLDVFIQSWGRMGVCWGVGKVMAEIQAVLFLSPRPLSLDEMSERLKTSRSNISLNVRALQDLGVVRKVLIPGDRKDYYTAEMELEKVARRLAAAKKKRELDPALDLVNRTIQAINTMDESLPNSGNGDSVFSNDSVDTKRLHLLKDLMNRINGIFEMFIDDDPVRSDSRETVHTKNL